MPKQPPPIGAIVDQLKRLRDQVREHNAQIKLIDEEIDGLEAELLQRMDKDQLEMVRGGLASASVAETTLARIEDFDAFAKWVLRNKALYMLERRVANAAYREMLNTQPKGVPGLVPFVKRTISLRSL